jgi:hypothetical protein
MGHKRIKNEELKIKKSVPDGRQAAKELQT